MARERDPFTPTFGVTPPELVGREEALTRIEDALVDGVGAAARATLVTGQRGTGKTVFLNAVEDMARGHGWTVFSTSASPTFVDDWTRSTFPRALNKILGSTVTRVTGANLSVAGVGGGLQRTVSDRYKTEYTLRDYLTELADLTAERGGGVMLTVDELDPESMPAIQQLSQAVQHLFREGREVMLVAAGLPAETSAVLSHPSVTFLRRAERIRLGAVTVPEVEQALEVPLERDGRSLGDEAMAIAVEASRGYPFMIQLVGSELWKRATPDEPLDAETAERAVRAALERVGGVHETALREASNVDRRFLAVMAEDDGPSRMGEIAARLGVTPGYASQYRLRLIDAGLIVSVARGQVDFALPGMRAYLRDHDSTAFDAPELPAAHVPPALPPGKK